MKKTELVDVIDTALQALPTGLVVLPNKEPSEWSKGYYDGMRVAYTMLLDLIQELED